MPDENSETANQDLDAITSSSRLFSKRRVLPLLFAALACLVSTYYLDFQPLSTVAHNATTIVGTSTEQSTLDHHASAEIDEINPNNTMAVVTPVFNDPVRQQQVTAAKNRGFFYSKARTDRSGSAVGDMFYAKAFAHMHNMEYRGACAIQSLASQRQGKHTKLLNALGLKAAFPFQCPPNKDPSQILDFAIYRRDEYLTPEFIAYLQSVRKPEAMSPVARSNRSKVVLHIRRGDVNPCTKAGRKHYRYTPNRLYLDVLDQVMGNNSTRSYTPEEVTIFSESRSTENFKKFDQYNLRLDGAVTAAWKLIAAAEVLILSKSSFSRVPALLNRNTVIYIPFWHRPLSTWQIVDDDILERANKAWKKLYKKKCKRHA